MPTGPFYEVKTNLDPASVSALALKVFALWVDFALGNRTVGGKKLMYPTGRYAASIQYKQEGAATVAIYSDAPVAGILEAGHGPVDLKTRLRHGRAYPLRPPPKSSAMWATARTASQKASVRGSTVYASIGPNSSPGSWIIPAMPAYNTAMILASQAQIVARHM